MADDDDEKARAAAEAEARRKRIMEKSQARMNMVSGLQDEADTEDEETKKNSAARMQAMRKRRFKKGGKGKEETAATSTTEGEENKDTTAITTEKKDTATTEDKEETTTTTTTTAEEKGPVEEEPQKQELPSAPAETVDTMTDDASKNAAESKSEDTPQIEEEATPDPDPKEAEENSSGEPKKKYKGVAKMRREKMLQKKKEEAAKAEQESKGTTSETPAALERRLKRLKQKPIFPIAMYILTTFLLFLAGLDVGLQHADDSIIVNRDFAPQQFSFEKLVPWSSSGIASIRNLDTTESNDLYDGSLSDEDEFNAPANDGDYVPNIDPLFRVDLDEVTQGPGVLMQLARGAVKIHRMIIFVLWETPMQMFALPRQLFQHPPVMCLAALTIRQVVAKLVLGAKLPDKFEEDVRNSKEMTDVLTMIKNAVKNSVMGTFPTAVSLYDGLQHLRTDMYVVLCGVFVGLLYSSWIMRETMPSTTPLSGLDYEEIIPDPEPEEIIPEEPAAYEDIIPEPDLLVEPDIPITDGIADEL